MASANDIYRDLLALPEPERLQLVERLIHDLVDAARHRIAMGPTPGARSVIGLWANEPEVVDQMIEGVLKERETRSLLGVPLVLFDWRGASESAMGGA